MFLSGELISQLFLLMKWILHSARFLHPPSLFLSDAQDSLREMIDVSFLSGTVVRIPPLTPILPPFGDDAVASPFAFSMTQSSFRNRKIVTFFFRTPDLFSSLWILPFTLLTTPLLPLGDTILRFLNNSVYFRDRPFLAVIPPFPTCFFVSTPPPPTFRSPRGRISDAILSQARAGSFFGEFFLPLVPTELSCKCALTRYPFLAVFHFDFVLFHNFASFKFVQRLPGFYPCCASLFYQEFFFLPRATSPLPSYA